MCFFICWKYSKIWDLWLLLYGISLLLNVLYRKVVNWADTSEFSCNYFIITKLYNTILVYKICKINIVTWGSDYLRWYLEQFIFGKPIYSGKLCTINVYILKTLLFWNFYNLPWSSENSVMNPHVAITQI